MQKNRVKDLEIIQLSLRVQWSAGNGAGHQKNGTALGDIGKIQAAAYLHDVPSCTGEAEGDKQ